MNPTPRLPVAQPLIPRGTVSRLNQRIYEQIEAWRQRPITGTFPYVYLDGMSLKRSWDGEVRNVSVPIAISVGLDGYRHILGVAEGDQEDLEGWMKAVKALHMSSSTSSGDVPPVAARSAGVRSCAVIVSL